MAQSNVDACNSALQKLGAARILSLDDNSHEARQCSVAFDSNRRSELRKHNWNFAIKRVTLAPDATAPAFGFTYAFTIPSDCLKILKPNDYDLDWVLEGRKILTNLGNTLELRYVSDVTDVTQWDAAFYDMFSISLAIDMCEAITNSTGKRQALGQEYKDAVGQARRNNAFEQLAGVSPEDSWIVVRW